MKLVVYCTDCGHTRAIGNIDTNGLAIDEIILETHSCECTHKCEYCEDLERAQAAEVELKEAIKKLKLQLKGAQLELEELAPMA